MKIEKILAGVEHLRFRGDPDAEISGIAYSSLSVKPGYLFAALKGVKTDGHLFIADAIKKGAKAILSEQPKPDDLDTNWIQVRRAREALAMCAANFYDHPSQNLTVIGVTGTKGKTTITFLLEGILKEAGFQTGILGTIDYRGPGLLSKATRTTPEAPDLQRMLRTLLDAGATHCVMEISSHALDLKRPVGTDFKVAIFTNLSGEHLDYHPSMEAYFEAKKKLFSLGLTNMAVINADDDWGKKLISQLTMGKITFGLTPAAMVHTESYSFTEEGIQLTLKFPAGRLTLTSPLLGIPNLYNILAAVSAALTLNVPLKAIKAGIAAVKDIPGRFERIGNDQGYRIFVDYAHSDDALRKLLETAKELCQARIILVFGAGGDRDRSKRPRMGKAAGELADWSILTSDNPRSEDPLAIIAEVEAGIKQTGSEKYEIEPDRKKAILKALQMGGKGDYILVAGKGHEDYQILGDNIISFDDRLVIQELLKNLEGKAK
ncbi:MAG: UDP-N-acetylmuramoyl-L-alanyl-D-glutamate--2,6-diaminopimelate ligase [Candidatus Aminicenantes bacterium]|nr:UDP-N-acetylmuramoyl-L-alanyl-D-glutamate--2,6-diaminopimelate ligase [Candidatus Aminicenantes bacterium]